MKDLIKKIKKDPFVPTVIGISILALIIGTLAIGFIKSFIFIFILDIIAIVVGKPKKKKGKNTTKDKLKAILLVMFSLGIFVLLCCVGFFAYIVVSAPKFDPEKLYNKEASVLYYNNNEVMAKLGTEIRQTITYDDIPEVLIDAIIATEDSRFFQHNGVDLPRFLKASISQVLGKGGGGASTLTMQVAKNRYTSTEDSGIEGIIRKFTDIYLSVFKIEKKYTKEEIIEFYVNSYYMGGGNYGVEQASRSYFGKSAKNMNVAEAALIAGVFNAPYAYDPTLHPEACEARRKTVLNLMLRHNYITQEEYEIALELTVDKLLVADTSNNQEYRDFIDTVVMEVIDRTGNDPYVIPMEIYTTMNKDQQDNMNKIMRGETFKWADEKIQGASIVIDVKTGAITAVGAGRNIKGEKVQNNATMMKRQIGSTAKPLFDYGPGIEFNNWSTYTPFVDNHHGYSDGTGIRNWDGKYFGWLTLNDSLKYSRNTTALKAFQSLKTKDIKQFVTGLGLSPEEPLHEAHAIGGYNGESPKTLAAAYAAFSNGGYYIEPHSFTKIKYTDSGDEYTVKPITRKAMSDATAYMITKVLEDTAGYAVGLNINNVNYCAKSGTTDYDDATRAEYKLPKNAIADRWIASFNDSYAIAVWYGYEYNSSEYYLTLMSMGQKYLFQAIAEGVYKNNSNWTMPDSVVEVELENYLPEAKLPSEFTPTDQRVKAYFKKGLEPTETSKRFSQLDNVTNLNYDEKTKKLTWDPIKTPDFIDKNYLNNLFTQMYGSGSDKDEALNERLNYNKKNIGDLTYNVYTKDKDGKLTLITSTTKNEIDYSLKDSTTFVVKTSYTKFTSNMSSGTEIKIEHEPVNTIITSEINGDSIITLSIGDPYIETSKPIIVLEDLVDVTKNATIKKTITRMSDNSIVEKIDTSAVETFQITYDIKYDEYSNTLTKIVEIK